MHVFQRPETGRVYTMYKERADTRVKPMRFLSDLEVQIEVVSARKESSLSASAEAGSYSKGIW